MNIAENLQVFTILPKYLSKIGAVKISTILLNPSEKSASLITADQKQIIVVDKEFIKKNKLLSGDYYCVNIRGEGKMVAKAIFEASYQLENYQ